MPTLCPGINCALATPLERVAERVGEQEQEEEEEEQDRRKKLEIRGTYETSLF